jgi:hypothetical protein
LKPASAKRTEGAQEDSPGRSGRQGAFGSRRGYVYGGYAKRVATAQPWHAGDQVGLGVSKTKVETVEHQAKRMLLEVDFGTRFAASPSVFRKS